MIPIKIFKKSHLDPRSLNIIWARIDPIIEKIAHSNPIDKIGPNPRSTMPPSSRPIVL